MTTEKRGPTKIRKYIIMGCIYLLVVAAAYYPFMFASQAFGKLDSDLKHIASTVIVASTGGTLFIIRNKVAESRIR